MDDYVFSVSEYIEVVNNTLKSHKITILGEVTSVAIRGGAVFFTIADTKEDAILECVIWKSVYDNLGVDLEEGIEVKIIGSASIYKKNGRFRFVAYGLIPIGEGALKKSFEKLKLKLSKEGYFDVERKRELPRFVKNIGLITADKSAAKKDFETHINKFGYKIFFYDVRVEGSNSINEIVQAFRWFNETPLELDVIVLTRGGGSLESLFAYNSPEVAKAIFSSKTPVLSAVGHEVDVTIADMVSDSRASTPTDAGKIIARNYTELIQTFSYMQSALNNNFKRITTNLRSHIFDNFAEVIRSLEITIENATNTIQKESELLRANDPTAKLQQGYSITLNSKNKVIKNSEDLKAGAIIKTVVHYGEIISEVKK